MEKANTATQHWGIALDRSGQLRLCVLCGTAALLLVTGCSIQGQWELVSVEPQAARRDVAYHAFTLQKDGSYYAEAEDEGIHTTSGTYNYEKGVLDFIPHEGPRRTFDADFESATRLHLERLWEGRKLELVYERRD
jgi:hypothetical protein